MRGPGSSLRQFHSGLAVPKCLDVARRGAQGQDSLIFILLGGSPAAMKISLKSDRADAFHGRLLFLDGEVRLVKNLTDLNHVAFVGGAPLHPFHELFF